MFVGSPIRHSQEEILAVAKKLKRNNVAVNVISYGNLDENKDLLDKFINAVNNNNNSSMVTVEPGNVIVDALFTSSIMGMDEPMVPEVTGVAGGSGNPGAGMVPQTDFDRDMQRAFELSAEEERKRKESEKKNETGPEHDKEMKSVTETPEEDMTEEQLLRMAMEMSKVENEQQVKKEKEKVDEEKEKLLEDEDFMKEVMDEIDQKKDETNDKKEDEK